MGITILVDYDGGRDLVPVTIWEPQALSIIELAEFISKRVQIVKKN